MRKALPPHLKEKLIDIVVTKADFEVYLPLNIATVGSILLAIVIIWKG